MFFEYMQRGGPAIMWPIAGLSFLATLFILERASYWLRYWMRRDPTLRRDVIDGRVSADFALAQSKDPIAEVAHWHRIDPDRAKLMGERLVAGSAKGIGLLEGIAGLSTSLGLFGTVVGVSISFDSLGGGKADEVAHGLAVALYTTVAGLIVYLYCFVATGFFRHLSEGLETELELAAVAVRVTPHAAPAHPVAIYNVGQKRVPEVQPQPGARP